MSNSKQFSRRDLLKTAIVVTPIAMTGCASLRSDEIEPPLRAEDPVARSMAYFPDTNNVPKDNPLTANHQLNQTCANCLHQRGAVSSDLLSCPTFPGRSVNKNGWCSLWVQG